MRWSVALRLGRVSNLPTVWSNVLAGFALSGAAAGASHPAGLIVIVSVAASLLYVGGMYLNDAFDRGFDAAHRPDRPIPSGQASLRAVLAIGSAMLVAGCGLLLVSGLHWSGSYAAGGAGVVLAALIVLYDLWHKGNPLSPVLMGLCRVMVYVNAALVLVPAWSTQLALGAAALLGYLIGLSYVAKHETGAGALSLWPLVPLAAPIAYGLVQSSALSTALAVVLLAWTVETLRGVLVPARRNVPRAVGRFIAGIALCDAIVIAAHGSAFEVVMAALAFSLTLALQRVVPGT